MTRSAICSTDPRFSPSRSTGKERDTESGNDYFGARYYASGLGRWLSPDWSAKEEPVPYAKLGDPQTLNLYSYVGNNPVLGTDADGHTLTLDQYHSALGAMGGPQMLDGGSASATADSSYNGYPDPSTSTPQTTNGTPAQQQSGSGKPTNQPVDPVPTGADGKPTPPPVPVPGCATCGWVWSPDPNNSRGGRWVPDNYPKTPGGIPGASWDPGSRGGPGHWDVDTGKGSRGRYGPDGTPMPDDVAHPPGWRPVWNSFAGWVGDHRREIIIGAAVVGVGAAIIVTGGAAAPLVLAIP